MLPPKFFHCNVYPSGRVAQGILCEECSWEPSITVKEILRVCQHSLDNPNPLSPSQQEGYYILQNNRGEHSRRCKMQAADFSEARFLEEYGAEWQASEPSWDDAATWNSDPAASLVLCRACGEQLCGCSDDPDGPRRFQGVVDGDRCLQSKAGD